MRYKCPNCGKAYSCGHPIICSGCGEPGYKFVVVRAAYGSSTDPEDWLVSE
jgi:predicted  nucleic acid-binding Zn-ribbon protein